MGVFRYVTSIRKWNADPNQQELARLFKSYAEVRKSNLRQSPLEPPDLTPSERDLVERIFTLLEAQRWPRTERQERVAHALGMIKVVRIDLYPIAQQLGQLIIAGGRR